MADRWTWRQRPASTVQENSVIDYDDDLLVRTWTAHWIKDSTLDPHRERINCFRWDPGAGFPGPDAPNVCNGSRLCKNSQPSAVGRAGVTQAAAIHQARIAAMSVPVPRICITRFRL